MLLKICDGDVSRESKAASTRGRSTRLRRLLGCGMAAFVLSVAGERFAEAADYTFTFPAGTDPTCNEPGDVTWTENSYGLAMAVTNSSCAEISCGTGAAYTGYWTAMNGGSSPISVTVSLPGFIFDLSSLVLVNQGSSTPSTATVQITPPSGGTVSPALASPGVDLTINSFSSGFKGIGSFTIVFTGDSRDGSTTFSLANLALTNITVHPGVPVVSTGSASSVSATGATLNGTVNDNGNTTTPITFDYGTTTGYGSTVTATPSSVAAGAGTTAVSAAASGLTCGTTYHFRVNATNSAGTTNGSDVTFTPPCLPSATTNAASSTSATGATLNGTVAANGSTTSIAFEYGLTSSYGTTATATPSSITGSTGDTAVAANLTLLACNTTYHFRVAATNSGGTTNGSDLTFTTSACAPSATTGFASGISGSGATVTGTVSANGANATVTFEYGTSTSYGSSVTATPSTVSGTGTSVEGAISGLSCGTTYHYRVIAVNSAGTTYGSDATFATTTTAPGAPTIGTATAGNAQATVTFTAPGSTGCDTITGYTATSNPGGLTGTSSGTPITVTGLTNGTSYTFTVTATTGTGTSAASAASNAVTPKASQTITFANPGAQSFGTSPTLSASSTSGLTVAFTSTTTGVCTVTGNTLTFIALGPCSIDANQSGNGTYAAAPTVSQTFAVNAVAPGAPTSVSATAGNAQATVSFSAPASNGGANIDTYTVTSSPGSITGTGSTTTITVTGLTNGTAYTFTVTATNSAGTGPASAASSPAVTPKGTQTISFSNPGTQNFGTTPTVSATATSSLTVTFSSLTTDVCTVTTGGVLTFVTAGPCTIAADQAGNAAWAAASTVSQGFTVNPVVPGAPTSVTATAGNGEATVTFSAPASNGGAAITGYTVTSSPGSFTASGPSPITVTGLTNGTAYTFTVTATNTVGTGPASAASSSVTPATVPDPPTIGTATASDGNATVAFTAPANDGGAAVTGYTVTSNPGSITVTGAASPILVTGLTNGTAYTFTVTATNSAGTSAPSEPSNTVTPAASGPGPLYQTITFPNPGPQAFGTAPPMSAGASSMLPVSFSSSTPMVCTTSSTGVLKLIRVGTCTINAGQPGDSAYYAAETVTQSFEVVPVVPGAPTMDLAIARDGQATVAFAPPTFDGGAEITGYTVTVSPGATTTVGSASPILVTGLRNGVAYTFTVAATNSAGTGPASSASDYAVPGPKGQMLAITGAAETGALTRLTERATNGHNLTVKTAIGVPSSLEGYDQVWDVRYAEEAALTEAERAVYLGYLRQGGSLLLVGESQATGLRDGSVVRLVGDAGGGSLSLDTATATQTVHAPLTGPVELASMAYTSICGATSLGRGTSLTSDGTASTAVAWAPGTLDQALAGGLVAIFDADFFRSSADAASRALLANLLNYLGRTSTASPGITTVTGPSAGSYKAGTVLEFTVEYGGVVSVTGTPKLPLAIDSAAAAASYAEGSATSKLVFKYTVRKGDNGALTCGIALDSTGGTLKDADGFPARVLLKQVSMGAVVLDTTAPSAPAITSITGTSLAGTAEPSTTVNVYVGGTEVATATVDAQGTWTCTLPANQAGALTVSASDAAGNTSDASGSVAVDTSVPVANAVAVTVPYNSTASPISLSITNATPTAVAIVGPAKHGTAAVTGTSASYTPTSGYSGTDSFTYTASNANGTSAPATVSITVSAPPGTAPTVILSTLSDGAVTSDRFLNISGVVTASGAIRSVTINDTALSLLAGGQFSYPVRLVSGPNTIRVTVTDENGLSATETRSVTLDTSAPLLQLGQPGDGAVLSAPSATVTGSVVLPAASADGLASIVYRVNGGAAQPVSPGNPFSFAASLTSGLNTIEIVATMTSGKVVHAKRTVSSAAAVSLSVVDPVEDTFVTAGKYSLAGAVAANAAAVSVTVTFAGQTYTPAVSNGGFTQALSLDTNQVWPVQITATDSDGHTTTVLRNLVKVPATDPTVFTMADAYRALQIANGLIAATAMDLARYDVAPMVQGSPAADGVIDIADAAAVLWLASGQTL